MGHALRRPCVEQKHSRSEKRWALPGHRHGIDGDGSGELGRRDDDAKQTSTEAMVPQGSAEGKPLCRVQGPRPCRLRLSLPDVNRNCLFAETANRLGAADRNPNTVYELKSAVDCDRANSATDAEFGNPHATDRLLCRFVLGLGVHSSSDSCEALIGRFTERERSIQARSELPPTPKTERRSVLTAAARQWPAPTSAPRVTNHRLGATGACAPRPKNAHR